MGEAKLTASPFMYLSNLTQQFSIERALMGFTNSAEICMWKPFTSQVCDTIENIWIVKLHKQNVKFTFVCLHKFKLYCKRQLPNKLN